MHYVLETKYVSWNCCQLILQIIQMLPGIDHQTIQMEKKHFFAHLDANLLPMNNISAPTKTATIEKNP